MDNESGKLQYVSVLRVFSMLLIILYHSLCFYVGTWWYLHTDIVPLWKLIAPPVVKTGLTTFVFISGFLYGYMYIEKGKYRNVFSFLQNKFRRLLIPYFFWGIIMILTIPEVHISWINLFTGIAHLWFLLMLFELFVIIIILNKIGFDKDSSFMVDLIVVIVSFIPFYLWTELSKHYHFLGFGSTFYYLPAFLVGLFYAKYGAMIDKVNYAKFFLFIGIALLFALSFLGCLEESTLYRLPAILISVSSMLLLKKGSDCSCVHLKYVNSLDRNSMGIYIFNQIVVFVLLLIPEMRYFLEIHLYFGVLLLFTVSLIIPWMLSYCFNSNKFTSILIG